MIQKEQGALGTDRMICEDLRQRFGAGFGTILSTTKTKTQDLQRGTERLGTVPNLDWTVEGPKP